jgi:two-component system, cell cycle response regulator
MSDSNQDRTVRPQLDVQTLSSKTKSAEPCLTVLLGAPAGQVYTLAAATPTVIGRGVDANLRLADQSVSRQHARLTLKADGPLLEDLGSRNGIAVNGVPCSKQQLKDGDKIQIGSCIIKFSYQDDVEQAFHQQLCERGIKDSLTGAYSKGYFLDRIGSDYAHAQRHHGLLALLMLQVDGAAQIRESHGQATLDLVLKQLAHAVGEAVRGDDILARYDGPQFTVLARNIGDEGVVVLAQRIRRLVKNHSFVCEDVKIAITVSLGIATLSDKVKTAKGLIQVAEKSLKKASKAGTNCIAGQAVKSFLHNTVTVRQSAKKVAAPAG